MNYIDLVILVFLILGFIRGIMIGMVKQLVSLVGLIVALFASGPLSRPIEALFRSFSDDHTSDLILHTLSYLVAFLCIVILFEIGGRLLRKAVNWASLGGIDKLLGIFFYELKIILLLSVIINIYEIADNQHRLIGEKEIKNSYFYRPVADVVPTIVSWVTKDSDWKEYRFSPSKNK